MIMKIRNLKGFTLAELLLAIAIISILSAVSFVNVTSHMRGMKQLELDGYAKEIFMSAQNHLIMAESNGYYGRSTASGSDDIVSGYFGTSADTTYHFVSPYNGGADLKDTLLYRMVPPGSIDAGNVNYIIRYDLNTGRVLDVFCTEKEGTSRYGLDLQGKYDELLNLRGDEKKGERKDYGTNKSVIGYYGGTEPISIDKTDDLKAPEVTIVNGEELTATVKVNESLANTIKLILRIEGLQSGSIEEFILYNGGLSIANNYPNVTDGENPRKEWIIKLDSIKSSEEHFGKLFPEFYPGEDVSLQAYLFDTSKVSNRAFGNIEITNSLFGNYTDINENKVAKTIKVTASIENLRHLENLSDKVSNVHTQPSTLGVELAVEKANQIKNINMADPKSIFKNGENGGVIAFDGTESLGLIPIYTGKILEYEGNNFSLEKIYIKPKADEYADKGWGIFGTLESGSKVKNLKIIDPSITGKNKVGALVGEALVGETTSCELSGVYVYESKDATTHDKGIKSDGETGTAGGLVGKMNGGSITGCFASVLVEAKDNAGGLVGEAVSSTIKASYSGGHTSGGKYQTEIDAVSKLNLAANIKAENGNAGGLIGNADNSTVQYCYSTCSASGRVAGGFVGYVSDDATISDCYCTGLVNGSTNANSGGFSGTGSASYSNNSSNNRYLETVAYDYDNQIKEAGGSDVSGIKPMDPDTGDIELANWNSEYADFIDYYNSNASDAEPYDDTDIDGLSKSLKDYYNQKYPFKTIAGNDGYKIYTGSLPNTDPDMIKTHHGDWPMVDTIVINISN